MRLFKDVVTELSITHFLVTFEDDFRCAIELDFCDAGAVGQQDAIICTKAQQCEASFSIDDDFERLTFAVLFQRHSREQIGGYSPICQRRVGVVDCYPLHTPI